MLLHATVIENKQDKPCIKHNKTDAIIQEL